MEQWRDIAGYEGLYQVSNHGRVRSMNYNRTGKVKLLKLIRHKDGYLQVNLFKNKAKKNWLVHRLVAQAFLDNPDNKPDVNHISGIKTDNRVENLEYCTKSENLKHAYTLGLKIISEEQREMTRVKNKETFSKTVKCITTGKTYNSVKEAGEQLGITPQCISACCRGKQKSAGKLNGTKLIWKYI